LRKLYVAEYKVAEIRLLAIALKGRTFTVKVKIFNMKGF